jgi:hypothetical protein
VVKKRVRKTSRKPARKASRVRVRVRSKAKKKTKKKAKKAPRKRAKTPRKDPRRVRAAKRAWQTRKRAAKARSERARRGWATRKKKERHREALARSAKEAWQKARPDLTGVERAATAEAIQGLSLAEAEAELRKFRREAPQDIQSKLDEQTMEGLIAQGLLEDSDETRVFTRLRLADQRADFDAEAKRIAEEYETEVREVYTLFYQPLATGFLMLSPKNVA